MKKINDKLSQGWYILTPINVGAEIPQTEKGVFYNESLQTLETYEIENEYIARCEELGIELNEIYD